MNMRYTVLALIIAIVCVFSTLASADDYDIQDFILPPPGAGMDLIESVGFTGSLELVKYQFKTKRGLTIAAGAAAAFRVTLPPGFSIAAAASLKCFISHSGNPKGELGEAAISQSHNGALSVSCVFKGAIQIQFNQNQIYFVSFLGFSYNAPDFPDSCSSSLVPSSAAVSPLGGIFDFLDQLLDLSNDDDSVYVAGNSQACCADVGLYYYGSGGAMESYGYASQCALPSPPGGGTGKSKLYDYKVAANTCLESSPTNLTATFRNSVELQSSSHVGFGNEPVPAYLWYFLPNYRASKGVLTETADEIDPWRADRLGITCKLFVDGKPLTVESTKTSPKVVVRPIRSRDQYLGIIVQCSLGSNTIPRNSNVKALISNVISPTAASFPSFCQKSSTSSSSACCDDAHVEYRPGNSVNDDCIYESAEAQTCPIFFKSSNPNCQAETNTDICSSVSFYPTQVTPNVSVNNAQYSFIPTVTLAKGTSITLKLPGFELSAQEQALLVAGREVKGSVRFVVGSSTPAFVDTTIIRINGALHFSVSLPFALTLNVKVAIFFQTVIPTPSLPSYPHCGTGSLSGTATVDGLCCREFAIEVISNGKTFIFFPPICPTLPGDIVERCETESGFSFVPCCTIRWIRNRLNSQTLAKCYKDGCTDSNFEADRCCTYDVYRGHPMCCDNAYFCPNHCCGQDNIFLPEGAVPCFNKKRCCARELCDEYSDLKKICKCWEEDCDISDYSEFEDKCCPPETTTAVATTGGSTRITRAFPPYCQCKELFESLEDKLPPQQNTIIEEFLKLHKCFEINKCCTQYDDKFEDSTYCTCLAEQETSDFSTEICCAFDEWSSDPICELPSGGCDQCNGSCCIYDKLNVTISNVTSTKTTYISLKHDPSPCCNSCGCTGDAVTSSTATVSP